MARYSSHHMLCGRSGAVLHSTWHAMLCCVRETVPNVSQMQLTTVEGKTKQRVTLGCMSLLLFLCTSTLGHMLWSCFFI